MQTKNNYNDLTNENTTNLPTEMPFPGFGKFVIHKNDEPDCPGITVQFCPNHKEKGVDIAYIRGVLSKEKENDPGDISIIAYDDPWNEDSIKKTVVSAEEIAKALETYDGFE